MHKATVTLSSRSLYSQSRPHNEPKLNKETPGDYEARTWNHRIHKDEEGITIPSMAFQNCLAEAAKFLSIQIPGKGKSTYTKHFEAGVIVSAPMPLISAKTGKRVQPPSEQEMLSSQLHNNALMELKPAQKKMLEGWERPDGAVWGDWVFVPSDGTAGSGRRVWKCYPMISQWTGEIDFYIADDTITEEVFTNVLRQAGQLIGVGRFRVRNRGNYGRFNVDEVIWTEV